jgi:hypothetical protein
MDGEYNIHGREEKYRTLKGKLKGQICLENIGVEVRIK